MSWTSRSVIPDERGFYPRQTRNKKGRHKSDTEGKKEKGSKKHKKDGKAKDKKDSKGKKEEKKEKNGKSSKGKKEKDQAKDKEGSVIGTLLGKNK